MADARLRRSLWIAWLFATTGLAAMLANAMLSETTDKRFFMPGALSSGHHQLELACTACHAEPLGSREVLQEACIDCHGADRKKPQDSHPRTKFQDPRNADRLENVDALHCVTCHTEHRPEITRKNGITQPVDLCSYCHRDIGEDRPSHQGMEFSSCAASGCHNFHDNRSLYTKFLIKHLDEPDILDEAVLLQREFATVLDQIAGYPHAAYPVKPLSTADADQPPTTDDRKALHEDWAASAHARAGVNCTACHQPEFMAGDAAVWNDHPDERICAHCHDLEAERFAKGRHGMRLAVDLPPLRVSESLLPMQDDAAHETLGCNSCHGAHRYDTRHAAAEACLECHNDTHTLAYRDSPHHELWQRELRAELQPDSGVSCAACHMPRIEYDVNDWLERVMVDHNQSANLSPNSKMIRSACLRCHGLEFSIDALADQHLIDTNFTGRPTEHVKTMDLAAAEKERRDNEASGDDDTSMFGF